MANDDQEIMIISFLVTLLVIMNEDCKFLKETVVLCRYVGEGGISRYNLDLSAEFIMKNGHRKKILR